VPEATKQKPWLKQLVNLDSTNTLLSIKLLISAVSCLSARVAASKRLMATQNVRGWAVRRAGSVMLAQQQHFGAPWVCLESGVCDAHLKQILPQATIDCDDVNGAMMGANSEDTGDTHANLLGLITWAAVNSSTAYGSYDNGCIDFPKVRSEAPDLSATIPRAMFAVAGLMES